MRGTYFCYSNRGKRVIAVLCLSAVRRAVFDKWSTATNRLAKNRHLLPSRLLLPVLTQTHSSNSDDSKHSNPPRKQSPKNTPSTMAQQHAGDGATGGAGRGGGLSGLFSKVQGHLDKLGLDKLPAVDQIQSNIRQQMTAHNPRQQAETLKLQLALKAAGGVAQNLESLGREEQLYSKNLFQWGKDEDGEDLKDLTDRLAYLIFKSAEVQKAQAERIKQSRLALKDVRNFENELQPRRAKRAALAAKLQQLKTSSKTAGSQVQQVEADLAQLTQEEETFSESLAVLKRQKLHEAFRVHFEGQREMGEKLAVIAGYAEVLLNGMETSGVGKDYDGMEKTAAVRASVAEKLDAYNPATPLIPTPQLQLGSSFLGRQDTGSAYFRFVLWCL
ncbi:hypothetical protein T439DRAFT_10792 [Meredithblackwellia eburnea MCA 4105]